MFWLPLIMMAVGTAAQMYAREQAREAAEKATEAELARQLELQRKGRAEFDESLKETGKAKEQIAAGQEETRQAYEQASNVPLGSSTASTLSTVPTRSVEAKAQRGSQSLSNQQRAQFTGLSDWQLKQAIKNARAAQSLALLQNMAVGSQNVLPLELQDATHAGDTTAAWGSILSGLGSGLQGTAGPGARPQTKYWGDYNTPEWSSNVV